MPKIDVDAEVYAHLEGQVLGFESPNKVLRRLLNIDPPRAPIGQRLLKDHTASTQPQHTLADGLNGGALTTLSNTGDGRVNGGGALGTLMRTKKRRTRLSELVSAGKLKKDEVLYFHDYSGNRIPNITATISGDDLNFKNVQRSMSATTLDVMQQFGSYESTSYRGPDFWYTKDGVSITELWSQHLREQGIVEQPPVPGQVPD